MTFPQSLLVSQPRYLLFTLGIISLIFSDLPYLYQLLGGISMQGAFYYFVPTSFTFLLKKLTDTRGCIANYNQYTYIITIIIWFIVATLANISSIDENTLQGRSGLEQLTRQALVVSLGVLSMLVVVDKMKNLAGQVALERGLLLSGILMLGYATIQWLASMNFPLMVKLAIFIATVTRYGDFGSVMRISGFKPEPSLFAVWFALIYPALLIGMYFRKPFNSIRRALLLIATLIVILSASRTAFVVLAVQVPLVVISAYRLNHDTRSSLKRKNTLVLLSFAIVAIFLLSLSKSNSALFFTIDPIEIISGALSVGNEVDNLHVESNAIRWGAQYAILMLALENPVFGTGLGQVPFGMVNHIPDWASAWDEGRDPFASLGIHMRIFAESGVIGFVLWIGLWFGTFYRLIRAIRLKVACYNNLAVSDPIVLLASGIGLFLCGLSNDSLSLFEYWVYAGMVISYFSFHSKKALRLFDRKPSFQK